MHFLLFLFLIAFVSPPFSPFKAFDKVLVSECSKKFTISRVARTLLQCRSVQRLVLLKISLKPESLDICFLQRHKLMPTQHTIIQKFLYVLKETELFESLFQLPNLLLNFLLSLFRQMRWILVVFVKSEVVVVIVPRRT